MRLLANIPHPILRISIFTNENRLILKLESGLYEQTYKFREGVGIDNVESIKAIVDEDFCSEVLKIVNLQNKLMLTQISKNTKTQENDFPVII